MLRISIFTVWISFFCLPIFSDALFIEYQYGKENGFQKTATLQYGFVDSKLSSLRVEDISRNTTSNYRIERKPTEVIVIGKEGVVELDLRKTSDTTFEVTRKISKNTFYVTLYEGGIYAGIQSDPKKRLLNIQILDKVVNFSFRRDGKEIEEFPFLDFSIFHARTLGDSARYRKYGLKYASESGFIVARSSDGVPLSRFDVGEPNKSTFTIADLFIDYFLGSRFENPVYLGVLLAPWQSTKEIPLL